MVFFFGMQFYTPKFISNLLILKGISLDYLHGIQNRQQWVATSLFVLNAGVVFEVK